MLWLEHLGLDQQKDNIRFPRDRRSSRAKFNALRTPCATRRRSTACLLKTLARWLKVDASGAEDAYLDLVRGVDRKPFASLDGLRNAQRFLRSRNPKVGEVKAEDVIDNRLMRKLDDSGFIDKLYAQYGANPK